MRLRLKLTKRLKQLIKIFLMIFIVVYLMEVMVIIRSPEVIVKYTPDYLVKWYVNQTNPTCRLSNTHIASKLDHKSMLEKYHKNYADFRQGGGIFGQLPLHYAASNCKNKHTLEYLLDIKQVDPLEKSKSILGAEQNGEKSTNGDEDEGYKIRDFFLVRIIRGMFNYFSSYLESALFCNNVSFEDNFLFVEYKNSMRNMNNKDKKKVGEKGIDALALYKQSAVLGHLINSSSLHVAAFYGCSDNLMKMIKYLDAKENRNNDKYHIFDEIINDKNEQGQTIIHQAAMSCNGRLIHQLISYLIQKSINSDDEQVLKHLIFEKMDTYIKNTPNLRDYLKDLLISTDSFGRTPLHYAVICYNDEYVQLKDRSSGSYEYLQSVILTLNSLINPLICIEEAEDDPGLIDNIINSSDNNGFTVLTTYLSSIVQNEDIINILIEHGSDLNQVDEFGRTILHNTIMTGSLHSLKSLLDTNTFKDEISMEDNRGWTPIHYAAYYNKLEQFSLLIQYGGVNLLLEHDHKGWSPIHKAAFANNYDIIRLLAGVYKVNVHELTKEKPYLKPIELLPVSSYKNSKILLGNTLPLNSKDQIIISPESFNHLYSSCLYLRKLSVVEIRTLWSTDLLHFYDIINQNISPPNRFDGNFLCNLSDSTLISLNINNFDDRFDILLSIYYIHRFLILNNYNNDK